MADPIAELVDALAGARRRQEVTHSAVAAAIGVTKGAVAGWEAHRDLPSAGTFILWATALGCTPVVVDESSGRVLTARPAPRAMEAPQEYRLRCFARVLRDARLEADLTQEQVAERLKVSQWTMQHWEASRRVPRLVRLVQWCRVLGCRFELKPGGAP